MLHYQFEQRGVSAEVPGKDEWFVVGGVVADLMWNAIDAFALARGYQPDEVDRTSQTVFFMGRHYYRCTPMQPATRTDAPQAPHPQTGEGDTAPTSRG